MGNVKIYRNILEGNEKKDRNFLNKKFIYSIWSFKFKNFIHSIWSFKKLLKVMQRKQISKQEI
mgnify:CR=1 FL=1